MATPSRTNTDAAPGEITPESPVPTEKVAQTELAVECLGVHFDRQGEQIKEYAGSTAQRVAATPRQWAITPGEDTGKATEALQVIDYDPKAVEKLIAGQKVAFVRSEVNGKVAARVELVDEYVARDKVSDLRKHNIVRTYKFRDGNIRFGGGGSFTKGTAPDGTPVYLWGQGEYGNWQLVAQQNTAGEWVVLRRVHAGKNPDGSEKACYALDPTIKIVNDDPAPAATTVLLPLSTSSLPGTKQVSTQPAGGAPRVTPDGRPGVVPELLSLSAPIEGSQALALQKAVPQFNITGTEHVIPDVSRTPVFTRVVTPFRSTIGIPGLVNIYPTEQAVVKTAMSASEQYTPIASPALDVSEYTHPLTGTSVYENNTQRLVADILPSQSSPELILPQGEKGGLPRSSAAAHETPAGQSATPLAVTPGLGPLDVAPLQHSSVVSRETSTVPRVQVTRPSVAELTTSVSPLARPTDLTPLDPTPSSATVIVTESNPIGGLTEIQRTPTETREILVSSSEVPLAEAVYPKHASVPQSNTGLQPAEVTLEPLGIQPTELSSVPLVSPTVELQPRVQLAAAPAPAVEAAFAPRMTPEEIASKSREQLVQDADTVETEVMELRARIAALKAEVHTRGESLTQQQVLLERLQLELPLSESEAVAAREARAKEIQDERFFALEVEAQELLEQLVAERPIVEAQVEVEIEAYSETMKELRQQQSVVSRELRQLKSFPFDAVHQARDEQRRTLIAELEKLKQQNAELIPQLESSLKANEFLGENSTEFRRLGGLLGSIQNEQELIDSTIAATRRWMQPLDEANPSEAISSAKPKVQVAEKREGPSLIDQYLANRDPISRLEELYLAHDKYALEVAQLEKRKAEMQEQQETISREMKDIRSGLTENQLARAEAIVQQEQRGISELDKALADQESRLRSEQRMEVRATYDETIAAYEARLEQIRGEIEQVKKDLVQEKEKAVEFVAEHVADLVKLQGESLALHTGRAKGFSTGMNEAIAEARVALKDAKIAAREVRETKAIDELEYQIATFQYLLHGINTEIDKASGRNRYQQFNPVVSARQQPAPAPVNPLLLVSPDLARDYLETQKALYESRARLTAIKNLRGQIGEEYFVRTGNNSWQLRAHSFEEFQTLMESAHPRLRQQLYSTLQYVELAPSSGLTSQEARRALVASLEKDFLEQNPRAAAAFSLGSRNRPVVGTKASSPAELAFRNSPQRIEHFVMSNWHNAERIRNATAEFAEYASEELNLGLENLELAPLLYSISIYDGSVAIAQAEAAKQAPVAEKGVTASQSTKTTARPAARSMASRTVMPARTGTQFEMSRGGRGFRSVSRQMAYQSSGARYAMAIGNGGPPPINTSGTGTGPGESLPTEGTQKGPVESPKSASTNSGGRGNGSVRPSISAGAPNGPMPENTGGEWIDELIRVQRPAPGRFKSTARVLNVGGQLAGFGIAFSGLRATTHGTLEPDYVHVVTPNIPIPFTHINTGEVVGAGLEYFGVERGWNTKTTTELGGPVAAFTVDAINRTAEIGALYGLYGAETVIAASLHRQGYAATARLFGAHAVSKLFLAGFVTYGTYDMLTRDTFAHLSNDVKDDNKASATVAGTVFEGALYGGGAASIVPGLGTVVGAGAGALTASGKLLYESWGLVADVEEQGRLATKDRGVEATFRFAGMGFVRQPGSERIALTEDARRYIRKQCAGRFYGEIHKAMGEGKFEAFAEVLKDTDVEESLFTEDWDRTQYLFDELVTYGRSGKKGPLLTAIQDSSSLGKDFLKEIARCHELIDYIGIHGKVDENGFGGLRHYLSETWAHSYQVSYSYADSTSSGLSSKERRGNGSLVTKDKIKDLDQQFLSYQRIPSRANSFLYRQLPALIPSKDPETGVVVLESSLLWNDTARARVKNQLPNIAGYPPVAALIKQIEDVKLRGMPYPPKAKEEMGPSAGPNLSTATLPVVPKFAAR